LIFIGIKIITAEFYQIDILWALLFVAVVLVGSIVLSILKNKAAFFGKGKK
jgi:ABC-type iron transport system FetAB permease component